MKKYLSNLIVGSLSLALLAPVASASTFADVQGHWAESSIDVVSDLGLFQGSGDNFMPDETMTRGMFVTVLGRLAESLDMDMAVETSEDFQDVAGDAYYADYVAWASGNQIVNGKGDGLFAPNDDVTREQMCAILVRFLNWAEIHLSEYEDDSVEFLDQDSISAYALADIAVAQQMGLIQGSATDDGMEFLPQAAASRSAVATVFVRLMDALDMDTADVETTETEVETETDSSSSSSSSSSSGGSSSSDDTTDEDEYTQEEIEAEETISGYLENMIDNYENSSYIATTDELVQETVATLMSCLEDALQDREDGVFLSEDYVQDTYGDTIAEMKVLYGQLTDEQYNQFFNVAVRLGTTEELYAVMDFFGVSISF